MEPGQYSLLIFKLSNQIRKSSNALTDYPGKQLQILHFILESYLSRDIYQKDIEEAFRISGASVSDVLKRMEARELITRERVPCDDRLKRILPTPQAIQMQERIGQTLARLEENMTEGIDADDLAVFSRVSQKMLENIGGSGPRSGDAPGRTPRQRHAPQ